MTGTKRTFSVNARNRRYRKSIYAAQALQESRGYIAVPQSGLAGVLAALQPLDRRIQRRQAARKERGNILTRAIRSFVRTKPDITVREVLKRLWKLPAFAFFDAMDHPAEQIGTALSIRFWGLRGIEQTVSIESIKFRVYREKKKLR